MIIFIHNIGESKSSWLPQMRALLSLGSDYSDQQIMTLFAVALPGHSFKDKVYDFEYTKRVVNNFASYHRKEQADLADKLIQTHSPEIIKVLRETELTIVGNGFGGAIAYKFALAFPYEVARIISIDAGTEFKKITLSLLKLKYKFLSILPSKQLVSLIRKARNPKSSLLYSIIVEYPAMLGLTSSLKLMKQYNFLEDFSNSSANQKIQFASIPMLAFSSEINFLSPLKSIKKLQSLLSKKNTPLTKNHSIAKTRTLPYSNYKIIIEEGCVKNPQDKNLIDFVFNVKKFIRSNLRVR